VVNLANLLTLRYDPESGNSGALRNIMSEEILYSRRTTPYSPTSEEIETAIRSEIRNKINSIGVERITLAISAGIDSNLILCLVRKEFPDIKLDCLTVRFDIENEDSSEVSIAKKIAEYYDAGFYEIYIENPLKDLPLLISIVREPRWNVYQYYFIEKASTISNVLFTGDGGDELFGGYTFRYRRFIENLPSTNSWIERARLYLTCHERDWVPDQDSVFGPSVKFDWASIYRILRIYFDNGLEPLEQVLLADYHGKLMYDFVPTNQKYFTHFGINGVAPLLSDRVIMLSERIPINLKYDYGTNVGKIQLRQILRRNASVNISHLIEDRKMGFSIDLPKFWISFGKEMVTMNLEKARIFEDKIINKDWYFKSMRRIEADRFNVRDISKMLQLLSLEIWYKLFVTSEITPRFCL
jgi:asparagine synthase (glutamine-hydrolysing)